MSDKQYAWHTVPAPEASVSGSKPLLSGPKRQHYLPRRYLEGLTKDEKVMR